LFTAVVEDAIKVINASLTQNHSMCNAALNTCWDTTTVRCHWTEMMPLQRHRRNNTAPDIAMPNTWRDSAGTWPPDLQISSDPRHLWNGSGHWLSSPTRKGRECERERTQTDTWFHCCRFTCTWVFVCKCVCRM